MANKIIFHFKIKNRKLVLFTYRYNLWARLKKKGVKKLKWIISVCILTAEEKSSSVEEVWFSSKKILISIKFHCNNCCYLRASVDRNCWPHLRVAFPNHGGGCCQSSDKERLSCYSPSSTCFQIKGPSLNPAVVTLYKHIFLPRQRRTGTFGCDTA